MKHFRAAFIGVVLGTLGLGFSGFSLGTAYGQPAPDTLEAETTAKEARQTIAALRAAHPGGDPETDHAVDRLDRSAKSIDDLVAKYKEATDDQRSGWAELLTDTVRTARKRVAEAKATLLAPSVAPPPGVAPPAPAPPSTGSEPVSAAAGVARQFTLSPQEQVAQAEGFVSRMESTRNSVQRQLETARTQRDVIKVLCLNDKLNQIDVAVRSARERNQALKAVVQRNDMDLANHEFTILAVLRQRTDQLTAEANQCIGEEGVSIDEAAVSVTVEDVPKQDPSEYPTSDVLIDVPSCASCFK